MNENNRARILGMLKDGLITVDEAEKLLSAMGDAEAPAPEAVAIKDSRGRKGKKFRIVVDSEDDAKKNAKVNVSIPISIIKTLGPVIAKNLPKEASDELEKTGVDLVSIMNSIDALIDSGSEEDIVNVDVGEGEGKTKVRIYVE